MQPPPTPIGPITLITGNLARSAEFYHTALGLEIMSPTHLGKGKNTLLILEERKGAQSPGRSSGLYHLAILLPSRKALARQWKHFLDARVPIEGASDHAVSEAIYLPDPEGNGIEMYCDRPRDQWVRKAGQIRMAMQPLNIDDLTRELDAEPWSGVPAGTVMGHIHLRVRELALTEAFYRDVIGMDVTARYVAGALFMSFNGYHHHLGLNIWESKGAPPKEEDAIGLKNFQIHVPNLERVKSAAQNKRIPVEILADGIALRDPSGNAVIVHG